MKVTDLLADAGRPVAYYPRLRQLTGSTNAALLLCQLIYWHGKQQDPEGWIQKRVLRSADCPTDAEEPGEQSLMDETGLTKRELVSARRKLRARGLVQERHSRSEHRMYFRVDLQALQRKWYDFDEEQVTKRAVAVRELLPGSARNALSLNGTYIDYTETTTESSATPARPQSTQPTDPAKSDAPIPSTPREAMEHPDIKLFQEVCGRIPGSSQYRVVVETMRHFRAQKGNGAVEYLRPFWLAWSGRKRKSDGKPYDAASLTWLTEWAMNGSIPPEIGASDDKHWTVQRPRRQLTAEDLAAAERINGKHRRSQLPALPGHRLSAEGTTRGSP